MKLEGQQRKDGSKTGRNSLADLNFESACDANSDLNKYCLGLVDLIAEHVPNAKAFVLELAAEEFGEERPAYETLLLVTEFLIAALPSQSRTLLMVKNLQQQVLQSKRELRQINKSYMQL